MLRLRVTVCIKSPTIYHKLLCQVLPRKRRLVYFLQLIYEVLNLLPCWSWLSLHRGKATQYKVIYAKCNGGPGCEHGYLAAFWGVAFKFTPTPALLRCVGNKINTSLRSKYKPSRQSLMHCFHLWFIFAYTMQIISVSVLSLRSCAVHVTTFGSLKMRRDLGLGLYYLEHILHNL